MYFSKFGGPSIRMWWWFYHSARYSQEKKLKRSQVLSLYTSLFIYLCICISPHHLLTCCLSLFLSLSLSFFLHFSLFFPPSYCCKEHPCSYIQYILLSLKMQSLSKLIMKSKCAFRYLTNWLLERCLSLHFYHKYVACHLLILPINLCDIVWQMWEPAQKFKAGTSQCSLAAGSVVEESCRWLKIRQEWVRFSRKEPWGHSKWCFSQCLEDCGAAVPVGKWCHLH